MNGALIRTLTEHTSYVYSLNLLPDGSLISGSFKSIKIWNSNNGTLVRTLTGHTGAVSSLVLLSDNSLASGSSDKTIKIWN